MPHRCVVDGPGIKIASFVGRPGLLAVSGFNVPGYNTNTDTIRALCDYFEIEPGELLKKV